MKDYSADSDKFGDEASSPLVEAFHSAVKDLVRQRFAASGRDWASFVFDGAQTSITAEDFAAIDSRMLALGHRYDWSAQVSLAERPAAYKPAAGGQDDLASFSFEHPEGTMRVKFSVEPPTGTAAKMTALEGTFKYLTAEKSDEFTIDEVAKKALKPLADPELKAAGVKLLLTKASNAGGESLTLSCGKGHFLGKAGISDPDDTNGVTQLFHSEVDKGQTVYRIQASDQGGKFSEKLQVKFKLYRDVKEHTVSFRFENVPLPKSDSKPKSPTQQN